MTQTRSSQTISVQLTPMQPLETIPLHQPGRESVAWVDESRVELEPVLNLQLTPGEPSELIVQIRNMGDRPLHLSLAIEGDFPPEWYQIGTEGNELPAGQQMDTVLYFQIAPDFFERHAALKPGQVLQINYRGRLFIRSTQLSSGQQSIQVKPFNLYVRPNSLYVNFLPDVYREIDFIGRFLKIVEMSFEPAVQAFDNLWAHLDPLTAPTALLPFLAYWVGWTQETRWDTATQRRLIRSAIEIYRWRGTRRGLRLYLHLYTGLPLDEPDTPEWEKHISIEEVFNQGYVLGSSYLGRDTILGGGRPYHFVVRLRTPQPDQIDEPLVRFILDQEKPAFCSYDLYIESIDHRPLTIDH